MKTHGTPDDSLTSDPATDGSINDLIGELRGLIARARQNALRAVDVLQVQTCWEVGRHIVDFEQ